MKYLFYLRNVIIDLFHYNELRKLGFTFHDIWYNEFHPKDKSKKVKEIIDNRKNK